MNIFHFLKKKLNRKAKTETKIICFVFVMERLKTGGSVVENNYDSFYDGCALNNFQKCYEATRNSLEARRGSDVDISHVTED